MNTFILIWSISLVFIANCGVLKTSEEQPISHEGALCGEQKCPDNQRCEMPTGIPCDSEEEDCPVIEARCVPIPPPVPKCKENEELKLCGSNCEPSCEPQETTICEEVCLTNVCQCKQGFVKDSSNNCRLKEDCEKCLLECPSGEKCEKVELPCEKEPCKSTEVCAVPADSNGRAIVEQE